jgi:hypothetical protein
MGMNKEKNKIIQTFCADSVTVAAAILMLRSNNNINSSYVDNTGKYNHNI